MPESLPDPKDFMPGGFLCINVVDDDLRFVTEVIMSAPRESSGGIPGIRPSVGMLMLTSLFEGAKAKVQSLSDEQMGHFRSALFYRKLAKASGELKDLTAAMTGLCILLNRAFAHTEESAKAKQGDT